jgi:hypothetical protein
MPRRTIDDRVKLLHGPYRAPRLRVGARAMCLYRDCLVVVTSWTDGLISWPRGLPVGRMGHPSIVVTEELARAIRVESAAAIQHWWGVSDGVIHRWRKALGVTRTNNGGTQRLIRAAAEAGASVRRGVPLPEWHAETLRRANRENNVARNLVLGYHGPWWSQHELALLGKLDDEEVARRTGRTPNAVRVKRQKLGILNPSTRPGGRPEG